MTRDEAITIMQVYKEELEHRIAKIDYDVEAIDLYSIQVEAYDMAIEALQTEGENGEGVVAYVCDNRKCGGDCDNCGRTTDIAHAKNFTRISDSYFERLDSVSVVRCKDCRHAEQRKQMPKQVYCKRDMFRIYGEVRDDDDFCKWGERREP